MAIISFEAGESLTKLRKCLRLTGRRDESLFLSKYRQALVNDNLAFSAQRNCLVGARIAASCCMGAKTQIGRTAPHIQAMKGPVWRIFLDSRCHEQWHDIMSFLQICFFVVRSCPGKCDIGIHAGLRPDCATRFHKPCSGEKSLRIPPRLGMQAAIPYFLPLPSPRNDPITCAASCPRSPFFCPLDKRSRDEQTQISFAFHACTPGVSICTEFSYGKGWAWPGTGELRLTLPFC